MNTDSCESRGVFAGEYREATRRHVGRGRRWRIRSSLQMFAAAFLIGCSLILHGCGGGGRAPVATPEGGGPATTPPPATIPPPPTSRRPHRSRLRRRPSHLLRPRRFRRPRRL